MERLKARFSTLLRKSDSSRSVAKEFRTWTARVSRF
jgi:hypothetical protein